MIVPRWYQQEAMDAVDAHFAQPDAALEIILALPCGTGKSVIIGGLVHRIFNRWPTSRVMVLSHVKELLTQNAAKITAFWQNAPVGIYSAGLKKKEKIYPITVAGVASIAKVIGDFGRINVVVIDECHMVSDEENSLYMAILAHLQALNPDLVVIGLSATIWRLGMGLLTEGNIFKTVAYNLCTPDGFKRLIDEGHLSPPIPKRTRAQFDLSKVKITAGDYNQGQAQKAMMRDERLTYEALQEACAMGADRHSWLAFCSGIDHAEQVADMLNNMGVPSVAVHSKMKSKERDARIAAYKAGEYRCLTNNGVFTTGHDHPPIDFIIGLRPTVSASLWCQIVGRGMRPSLETGKTNCLVADYVGNCENLGPIDDPVLPKKRGATAGEPPIKLCPVCAAYNHPRAKFCCDCGTEFTFEPKIHTTAATTSLLKHEFVPPIIEDFFVDNVLYNKHKSKASGVDMIRASYFCGVQRFSEFLNFEAKPGLFLHKAHEWWRKRFGTQEVPESNEQALMYIRNALVPHKLRVVTNRKPQEIVGHEFRSSYQAASPALRQNVG